MWLVVAFVLIFLLSLANIWIVLALARLEREMDALRADATAIRRQLIPANAGGRAVPSPADLAAARNRIDSTGTAHPGGPG